MYLYSEGLPINDIVIGVFALNNTTNEYELIGKTTEIINYENKNYISINVQLSADTSSFIIRALVEGKLMKPNNNIYNEIGTLKIGKNNLVTSLSDLPVIKF